MNDRSSVPTVYILHGDDTLAIQRFLQEMLQRMGDPGTAELNTSILDGRQTAEDELRTAATSMPFLANRRLVILYHPLARLGGKDSPARQRFLSLLDNLPQSTALVLVIEDQMTSRSKGWDTLKEKHWLKKWIKGAGSQAFYQAYQLPQQNQMPGWIMQHAREMGGQLTNQAAALLASYIGNNTHLAHLEIDKLLTYVNYERPVEIDEIEMLTAPGSQAGVFDMIDALAMRDGRQSMRMFQALLEKEDAIYLFIMILRQFRLLLQTREILDEGGSADSIASELSQAPFVAKKLEKQARRFNMTQLEEAFHELFNIDQAVKTSQVKPELAIATFIFSLVQ